MQKTTGITILGSTGTIGINTLDVISRNAADYHIIALTANTDIQRLFEQCKQFYPQYAVIVDSNLAKQLQTQIKSAGLKTEILAGKESLEFVAALPQVDCVMAAIVGAAGLLPTLAAAKAGKRILLANKEALVMSGQIFMDTVIENDATLLPIDSEHNAIFQCLPENYQRGNKQSKGVEMILLTASGGPFRNTPLEDLVDVTPEMACAHPNWEMGRKISVDSATMMNKGLEVIEAYWLFGLPLARIKIVLHPESIIHSMVSYSDGSVLAQLGNPDMRTPIAHGLAWPRRMVSGVEPLDLFTVAQLNFSKPDIRRFKCLRLALDAMEEGGTATTVLNAANEVAVAGFLAGNIRFTDIPYIIESSLEHVRARPATSLQVILEDDSEARRFAIERLKQLH